MLRNARAHTVRIAPLFDHGLSLLYSCNNDDEIRTYDVLDDKKCQCFIGGMSTFENLEIIKNCKPEFTNGLKCSDKELLFEDLQDVLSGAHINAIWEMIYKRYEIYENL